MPDSPSLTARRPPRLQFREDLQAFPLSFGSIKGWASLGKELKDHRQLLLGFTEPASKGGRWQLEERCRQGLKCSINLRLRWAGVGWPSSHTSASVEVGMWGDNRPYRGLNAEMGPSFRPALFLQGDWRPWELPTRPGVKCSQSKGRWSTSRSPVPVMPRRSPPAAA